VKLDLNDKTALVCGASRGIGAAIARELAGLGCRIIAQARSEDALAQLVADLPGSGHRVLAGDIGATDDLVARLGEGPVQILINNTGGPKPGPIAEAEADAFLDGLRNHVVAASVLTRALLPGMKAASFGRIINVISTSVKAPIPNLGVSNTIRGAMANWAKTLSVEVAPYGITVNNILPGFTDTPRLRNLIEAAAGRTGKTVAETADAWRQTVPARRFAEPAEVAAAAAFLASPAAAYINGINLPVDGGRTPSL